MSVRRLAEPALQPPSFAFSQANETDVQKWIAKYPKGREQSAVIPLLMIAQDQEGWVSKAAIESIANRLGMPYIRALEVATFYTQYQLNPVGTRAHIQVCGTTPCMLRGAEALIDVCRSKIHHDPFHTNAAGTLSWEEVECLGACVNAPMVMVFKDTFEDLTPERLSEIIDAFEAGQGASVPVGPQVARVLSAPQSGLTSLRDEKAILKSTRDAETARAEQLSPGAASGAPDAGGALPPSNAAKPKTDAIETSPALKTPSPEKTSPSVEKAASVAAPAHNAANANTTSPEVEGVAKQRRGKSSDGGEAAMKSPELLRGEPLGPTGKRADGSQAAPVGTPSPEAARAVGASPADGASTGGKPARLDDANKPAGIARPATPDDLKLISGVGPKIEGTLNSLGIFTFAQVAAWSEAERQWVDGYLNFRGRIERDNWVRQADALATGGVAEYVRVFGKDPR